MSPKQYYTKMIKHFGYYRTSKGWTNNGRQFHEFWLLGDTLLEIYEDLFVIFTATYNPDLI